MSSTVGDDSSSGIRNRVPDSLDLNLPRWRGVYLLNLYSVPALPRVYLLYLEYACSTSRVYLLAWVPARRFAGFTWKRLYAQPFTWWVTLLMLLMLMLI